MSSDLVTVLGGTGFLGRVIVGQLLAAGIRVRRVARHPATDQTQDVEQVQADIRDENAVSTALEGARAVVNAVGLYVERGAETFEAIHVQGALNVAREAKRRGLGGLVHISGIGADLASPSRYVRARAEGEQRIMSEFDRATILRPSVLFGPDDAFLSALDGLTRFLPVVPLFGSGSTRLQPVYVNDIARAVTVCLGAPPTAGQIYELGGAETYTYRELLAYLLRHRERRRLLLPVPFILWELQARLLSVLPAPPLTRDQIALMRQDNVVSPGVPGFADLGITPVSLRESLPHCLGG